MTMVELLVAVLILAIGILSTFVVFGSSQRATHVSEILEGQTHLAQREIERIQSLPYSQIGLTSAPLTSTDPLNPDYYVSSGSGCASFTWNQSTGATNSSDALVVNGCTYSGTTYSGGVVQPSTTTAQGYAIYDFVTWVNDDSCGTAVAGICKTSNSYKRVTVDVIPAQVTRLTPTRAVLVSAIVSDPHAAPAVQLNVNSPLVTCDPVVPSSTPCNYGLNGQTANVFYLTDSPEQSAIQTTGTTTNSSNIITNMGTTTNVQSGMAVAGPGLPSGARVSSVDSSTQIHISTNATATATVASLAIGPTAGLQTTGTTTSGSSVITGMATTTGIQAPTASKTLGMYMSGPGIPTGATVTSVDSPSEIHISDNATATATSAALSIGPYLPRAGDNGCMHYTEQLRPLNADGTVNCGGTTSGFSCGTAFSATTTVNACPQPDLLFPAPAPTTVTQEYNFSPNIQSGTAGRVINRDPSTSVSNCSAAPSNNAASGEFWASQPLGQSVNLTGFAGMTLYTRTLGGGSQSVTLCVAVYLESPVATAVGSFLDPLNLLCGSGCTSDSTALGGVSYTMPEWPATLTPLSFSFNYMTASKTAPVGSSIGVRMWVTNNSGDDIVVQYDASSAASNVELDSQ